MLDEAANIAPLPDLDVIAATGASHGIQLVTILQDLAQAHDRWGRERADTIVNNHRALVFGAGISDARTLETVGRLLGSEEVEQRSSTTGSGRDTTTRSSSLRALGAAEPPPRDTAGPCAAGLRHAAARPADAPPVVRRQATSAPRGGQSRALEPYSSYRLSAGWTATASSGSHGPSTKERRGGPPRAALLIVAARGGGGQQPLRHSVLEPGKSFVGPNAPRERSRDRAAVAGPTGHLVSRVAEAGFAAGAAVAVPGGCCWPQP